MILMNFLAAFPSLFVVSRPLLAPRRSQFRPKPSEPAGSQ